MPDAHTYSSQIANFAPLPILVTFVTNGTLAMIKHSQGKKKCEMPRGLILQFTNDNNFLLRLKCNDSQVYYLLSIRSYPLRIQKFVDRYPRNLPTAGYWKSVTPSTFGVYRPSVLLPATVPRRSCRYRVRRELTTRRIFSASPQTRTGGGGNGDRR